MQAARRCAAETHASVRRLNGLVVDALVAAGVPAAGVSPLGCWATSRRGLVRKETDCAIVREMLDAGLVPVIHGDVVRDAQQGWAILSGDTILARLCEAFQPQLAVFMVSVPAAAG
jgi:isopentenyl phosphate kinase